MKKIANVFRECSESILYELMAIKQQFTERHWKNVIKLSFFRADSPHRQRKQQERNTRGREKLINSSYFFFFLFSPCSSHIVIVVSLLNPKVIRACTWCLQTWEKMNSREIKSAVTLLHRIAVNLNVPVMLMQAQLFRVFQQVFGAPRDVRYEELRRLGQFVVRHFVKLAPENPKIYAELLFFKSARECVEVASGYSESMDGNE